MDLTEPWDMSDMTLIVDDKKIYISKAVVSIWSPVLLTMFTAEFKEKHAKEVTLPGKSYDDILELMRTLHVPNKTLDDTKISTLLSLAREYQMAALTSLCEQSLLRQEPSVSNFLCAEEYTLPQLREKSWEHLVEELPVDQLTKDEHFAQLDHHMRESILTEKCRKVEVRAAASEMFMRELIIGRISKRFDTRHCTSQKQGQHYLGTDIYCKTCCLEMIRFIQYRVHPKAGRFRPTLDF